MSLKFRRIIYLAFIILFLITAPILILYTSGYRYDWRWHKIQKTGSLAIKPSPTDSDIYVNNELQTGSRSDSTLRLNNLLPDEYNVKITRDNYYDWQKKLRVESGLTTFVNQAALFKKQLPEKIIDAAIATTSISPDKNLMAYTSQAETGFDLGILNFATGQKNPVALESASPLAFSDWSDNGKKIIIKQDKKILVVDAEKLIVAYDLTAIIKSAAGVKKIEWGGGTDYILYYLVYNDLWRLNLTTSNKEKIWQFDTEKNTAPTNEFTVYGNQLYYIDSSSTGSFLTRVTDWQADTKVQLLGLPASSHFQLKKINNDIISIIDPQKEKVYLWDAKNGKLIMEGVAKDLKLDQKNQRLIVAGEFEIYVFDLGTQNKELITRYGQIISDTDWIPALDYLTFVLDNTINITELDGRDVRNTIQLARMEKITDLHVDESGKNLYFIGTLAGKTGLYKLEIQ